MSRREDRPVNFTGPPFRVAGVSVLEAATTKSVLDEYEAEMKPNCHPDVLTWHLIVLENFLDNFLAERGYLLWRTERKQGSQTRDE